MIKQQVLAMKYLLFFLILSGTVFAGYAQGSDPYSNSTEIVPGVSKEENSDYLRQIQNPLTPKSVKEYQVMAVNYDLGQTYIFDGRDDLFLLAFITQKGQILASYNRIGEVVKSVERFRDIALPSTIIRMGMKNHSGWRVIGTNYYVFYIKNKRPKVVYTIRIADGDKRKKILLDREGTIVKDI